MTPPTSPVPKLPSMAVYRCDGNGQRGDRSMTAETSLLGLAGKKAMVIGGGQGMGESTSRFLARAGCDVAVIDVERERAERVAGIVGGIGCRGVPIIGNVLDDAQIPEIVASAERQLDGIDAMVSIVGAAV